MVGWTVEVLDSTVEAELDTFPRDLRAALTRIIERIGNLGLDRIGEPHVRHVEGKLWEMRPSGSHIEGRALYVTATGRRVVIVLAFIKKTRKTPKRFIELALVRAKSIKS
jgi:phage-related protein